MVLAACKFTQFCWFYFINLPSLPIQKAEGFRFMLSKAHCFCPLISPQPLNISKNVNERSCHKLYKKVFHTKSLGSDNVQAQRARAGTLMFLIKYFLEFFLGIFKDVYLFFSIGYMMYDNIFENLKTKVNCQWKTSKWSSIFIAFDKIGQT